MTETLVYKILSASDWQIAEAEGVTCTALDEQDGYVHLSTRAQVGETLALHYSGAENVRLLEYSLADLRDIKWEPSRGGQMFPHLYDKLHISKAKQIWVLKLDSSNIPKLPRDI